jgi:hypothetical protein
VPTAPSPRQYVHAGAMQQRINRLEGLVKTLMTQSQQVLPQSESDNQNDHAIWKRDGANSKAMADDHSALPSRIGITVMNEGLSVYKAANDWSDVLEEVSFEFHFMFYCSVIIKICLWIYMFNSRFF